jgi:hypothetical protein
LGVSPIFLDSSMFAAMLKNGSSSLFSKAFLKGEEDARINATDVFGVYKIELFYVI